MNIEAILAEWEVDCDINQTDLSTESRRTPKLHAKYYKMLVHERLRLRDLEIKKKELFHDLHEYYTGDMSEERLKELDWEPRLTSKVLKSELPIHIDADKTWINMNCKMVVQQEKVTLLEDIIKVINNRSFHINNIISWEKFRNGIGG